SPAPMRVCVVPPLPAIASTFVPPAGGVTTTSYVPDSRSPKLYWPLAFVVVLATAEAPCSSVTVTPPIGARSAVVAATPSQSPRTVPNTSPYVNVSRFTHVPSSFGPFVHSPAYQATVCDGDCSEASWSIPV